MVEFGDGHLGKSLEVLRLSYEALEEARNCVRNVIVDPEQYFFIENVVNF